MPPSSSRIHVLNQVEESIIQYISERRKMVEPFLARHFSLQETLLIQKKYWVFDLLCSPLNALWAIPYLSIKKVAEFSEKLGWIKVYEFYEKIPSAIKTGYQRKIELLLSTELMGLSESGFGSSLLGRLKDNKELMQHLRQENISVAQLESCLSMKKELENYSSGRALISDTAGSVLTLILGWAFFGDRSLGITDIGQRIAEKMARDDAASSFFLGKGIGSAFYNAFPPHPTKTQIFFSIFFVGLVLTVVSMIVSVLSDPLQKKLGFQKLKLGRLLDNIEQSLILRLKKELRKN